MASVTMTKARTVLITGGTGFIGSNLTQLLLDKGYTVIVAGSTIPQLKHKNLTHERLDLSVDSIPNKYDGKVDAFIHLAGQNIFGRWTDNFKTGIYSSRIDITRQIVKTIGLWVQKPSVFICASAFGFYGDKVTEFVRCKCVLLMF